MQSPKEFVRKFNSENKPAKAPTANTVSLVHGIKIKEKFTPLERDTPNSQAWIAAQNERLAAFTGVGENREEMAEHLSEALNYPRETLPIYAGGKYFSTFEDGSKQQNICLVRDSLTGEPTTLIDLNDSELHGEKGLRTIIGIQPNSDGSKLIVSVSNAGLATAEALVFDVEKREFTNDSFDSSFGLRWSPGKKDAVIYNRWNGRRNHYSIAERQLGSSTKSEKILFDFHSKSKAYPQYHRLANEKGAAAGHEFLTLHSGTFRNNGVYVRSAGAEGDFDLLFDDGKAQSTPVAEMDGKLLMLTDHEAPMGRLVAVDYANPAPENWETIIPENPKRDLESVSLRKGRFVANYLEGPQSRISIFDSKGKYQHDVPIPEHAGASLSGLGPNEDRLMLSIRSFKQATEKYFYDPATNEVELFEKAASKHDLKDAIVEQIEAISPDGTRVPMTVVRGKDTKLDGSAATLLSGYGGFDIPLSPSFSPEVYNWVNEGGIYVQANLRGGGEFGQEWYDNGRLANKQNVFDDFAACAEKLIESNYTTPARLAIEGGSNGGLLTLATSQQRPELFGAVISNVPVTDLLDRASWPSDYGIPRLSEDDYNIGMKYSPLQNIKDHCNYPPTLVVTGQYDDIVPPHQAMKMVAARHDQTPGSLCFLKYNANAGHKTYTKNKTTRIESIIESHSFLEQSLGPINQDKFKAAQAEWGKEQEQPYGGQNTPPQKTAEKNSWRNRERERILKRDELVIGREI